MMASFYIAATSPFEELSKNRLEQFNETIVFLCGLFQMVLSGITVLPSSPQDDPTTRMVLMRSILSYLIMMSIGALLVINFGITLVEIVRQTIVDLKRKYALRKALKKMQIKN